MIERFKQIHLPKTSWFPHSLKQEGRVLNLCNNPYKNDVQGCFFYHGVALFSINDMIVKLVDPVHIPQQQYLIEWKWTQHKQVKCSGLQIRPVKEQLKQRVIGKRYYCISKKRKSYKGNTSLARLAFRLSNVSFLTRSCLSRAS